MASTSRLLPRLTNLKLLRPSTVDLATIIRLSILSPRPHHLSCTSSRHFCTSHRLFQQQQQTPSPGPAKLQLTDSEGNPIVPRLSLTFTCTASGCGHRSKHEFSRRSYEKGIVIVQCPGCKNRHLIADHLSWFKDDGEARTVEDMVREHGGRIRKGYTTLDGEGAETIEIESDNGVQGEAEVASR